MRCEICDEQPAAIVGHQPKGLGGANQNAPVEMDDEG